jgi:hypothetical protein
MSEANPKGRGQEPEIISPGAPLSDWARKGPRKERNTLTPFTTNHDTIQPRVLVSSALPLQRVTTDFGVPLTLAEYAEFLL